MDATTTQEHAVLELAPQGPSRSPFNSRRPWPWRRTVRPP